jgi:hypothetical protein
MSWLTRAGHDPMPIQWRVCSRWALLGVIEKGELEAFAVLDPLTHKTEAIAIFNHAVMYMLTNPELWLNSSAPRMAETGSFWSSAGVDAMMTRML